MKPNKKGFWVLVVIFGLLTVFGITKARLDGESPAEHDVSMGDTMGTMMRNEYEGQLTLDSLLGPPENSEQMEAMANHHTPAQIIKLISDFSTGLIYIMLPVLMGGVATLTVLWTGKEVK